MKWTKRLLIVIVLLAVGFFAGVIVISIQWHKIMSRFAAGVAAEIAIDARLLHSGNADVMLDRKTQAIPSLVQQLHSAHRRYLTESQYNHALWSVARFYEDTKTEVPSSIRPIMESLPPPPKTSCELRSDSTDPQNDQENAQASPAAHPSKDADEPTENAQSQIPPAPEALQ